MAKRDPSAEALEQLKTLAASSDAAALVAGLRDHLKSKYSYVVARAAKLIDERQIDSLGVEMMAAFERFMVSPVKTDPGCGAKTALVAAGVALDCLDVDVYLRAIRHVQMEGSFGPPIDTAAKLRGHAAYGLLNRRHPDALREIVSLIQHGDEKGQITDARRAGLQVLGTLPTEASAVMLRMACGQYADDPETLAEAFASLNAIEPDRSFDFLSTFLASDNADIVDVAALAIAEGRQPRAVETLLAAWPVRSLLQNAGDARAYFTALAITRKPAAIEFLLDRVGSAAAREAVDALGALELLASDEMVRNRVQSHVKARGDRSITQAAKKFQ